jgi:ribosomal-protein-alanine N-acetyltransferase
MSVDQPRAAIVVRKLLPQDAAAVERIAQRSPEAAQWSRGSYALENDPGRLAWVAEADGTLCGFFVARVMANDAEILNLAVDPANRRAGSASALLHQALEEFRRLRVERVFLEVRESNLAAARFYETHGFARAGQRAGYYRDPDEGAVLMIRKLTA